MRRNLPWFTLAGALVICTGVFFYIQSALNANDSQFRRERPAAKEIPLSVSVTRVTTAPHAATISAVGLANANNILTLTTQVSGEVIKLSPDFEIGQHVHTGQRLAQLSNISLYTDLANAKHQLASSELALKEEQRQGEQANAEWQAAGLVGEPASDLVLRGPQLAAAKADLVAAKAAVSLAQDKVNKLNIVAPFDGFIAAKNLSLGSYLSANANLATLYSSDKALIELPLSQQDWHKLPPAKNMLRGHWPATVHSIEQADSWQGYVHQASMHIDTESGLRSLYIAVDSPLQQQPALLLGSYVRVTLQGKNIDGLWQLPNSALSQKSQIWYVDEDSRLANFDTTPVFVDQEFVYIQAPEALKAAPQTILTHPYNSYLTGMLVAPEEADSK